MKRAHSRETRIGMGWFLFALLAAIASVILVRRVRDEASSSSSSSSSQSADAMIAEGLRAGTPNSIEPSQPDLSDADRRAGVTDSIKKSSLVLNEGEFSAIASASRSADVLLRNKALNRLQALAVRTSNLSLIRDELLSLESTDAAFAPIVAALAAVGTPEIQALLRQIVEQRSGDWRTYSGVVPSLGLLTQPVPETVEFLLQQSRLPDPDFSSTAALAIGSIVQTLSKTEPRKGEQLLASYLSKIETSDTAFDDLKESLAVVGNSGLLSAIPTLLKQIEHPRPDVRAEVVMALRFMRTPEVEDVLLSRLFADSDLEVRLRVVDALVHGPVPERALIPVADHLKRANKTPAVLREKFLELFFHVNLSSDSKRKWAVWLTHYVEVETDPAVRRKASAALEEILRTQ